MRISTSLVLSAIVLVSCSKQAAGPEGGIQLVNETELTVRLLTETAPSADGTMTTNTTYVVLSGAVEDSTVIEDYDADGTVAYETLDESLLPDNVLGAYWSYYAGAGILVAVKREGDVLQIEKRMFTEPDPEAMAPTPCTPWEIVRTDQLKAGLPVAIVPTDTVISERASVFCGFDGMQ